MTAGVVGRGGMEQKEKRLKDMGKSVVIAGGGGIKGLNGNRKIQ